MGSTACTEPQCLYKGELYLYCLWAQQEMKLLLHKTFGKLIAGLSLWTSGCNPTAVM